MTRKGKAGRFSICASRIHLATRVYAFFITLLVSAHGQSIPSVTGVRVLSLNAQPIFVVAPPGDFTRLFIVEKIGFVGILHLDTGTFGATPFLNISQSISISNEEGLLGMAFDPNYASNGKFYLNFNVPGGEFNAGVTHVSQFQVSANPDAADPTSLATIGTPNEKLLVKFDQPQDNHNGGWIGFSPRAGDENNLYIATGDGGAANDQGTGHIEPGGNAQNLTTLLGKMLRIHVDATTGAASIPPTNPFANTSGARGEIFAYGLRNPFRDSFDRLTGRFFIADVGQDNREELDVQQPTNTGGGENYGWRLREGTIATPTGNPPVGGATPSGNVEPIFDYSRTTGGTIIGGYVYRGKQIPQLQGTYVFGDYVNRKVFALNYDGVIVSNFQDITSQLFPTHPIFQPSSLGEDANGELYICDIDGRNIYKIAPTMPNVKIDSVTKSGSFVTLHGIGVPFTNVTLEAAPNPNTASFTFLANVSVSGDGTFQYSDNTNLNSRFYHVVYP